MTLENLDKNDQAGLIDLFFDWIRPLIFPLDIVDQLDPVCIGWKLYEESSVPTLIYLTNNIE